MASIILGSVAEAKLKAVKDCEFSSSFVSLSLKIYLRVQYINNIQLHLKNKHKMVKINFGVIAVGWVEPSLAKIQHLTQTCYSYFCKRQ